MEEDSLAKAIYKQIESVESSIDENESDESVEIDKEFSYDYCDDSLNKSNILNKQPLVEIKREKYINLETEIYKHIERIESGEIDQEFTHLARVKKDSFSIRMEEDSLSKAIDLQTDIHKRIESIESSIDENESDESVEIEQEFSHLTQNKSFSRDLSQDSYMHNDEYHEDSLAKAIRLQPEIYKQIEALESSIDENESDQDENHLEDYNPIQPEICIKRDQFSGQMREDSFAKDINLQTDIYEQIESNESSIDENEFEKIDIHNDNHCDDSLDKANILVQPLIQIKRDSFSRPLSQMEEDSLTKAINSKDDVYRDISKRIETVESTDESLEIEKEFSHLNQNKLLSRDSSQESDKYTDDYCEDSLAKATNLQSEIYKQTESLESSLDENESDKDDKHNDDIELFHHFEDSLLNAFIFMQADIYKQMELTLNKNESDKSLEIEKELSHLTKNKSFSRDSSQESEKHNEDQCEQDFLDNSNILIEPLVCTKSDSFSRLSIQMEEESLSKDISLQTVIYKQMESSIDENESDESVEIDDCEDSLGKSNVILIKRDSFSKTLTQIGEDSLGKDISLQTVIYNPIETMESSLDENESDQIDNEYSHLLTQNQSFCLNSSQESEKHNVHQCEDSLTKSNVLNNQPLVLSKMNEDFLGKAINLQADIYKNIESMESSLDENESDEINKFSHHCEDKKDSFSRQIEEDSLTKDINLQTDIYKQIESLESSIDENESDQDDKLTDNHCEDSLDKSNILKTPLLQNTKDLLSKTLTKIGEDYLSKPPINLTPLTKLGEDSLSKEKETIESSIDENEFVEIDQKLINNCQDSPDNLNILTPPLVQTKGDSFSRPMEEDSLTKAISIQTDICKHIETIESSLDKNESEEIDNCEESLSILKNKPEISIKRDSFSKPMKEDSMAKSINLQEEIYFQIETIKSSIDVNESLEMEKEFSHLNKSVYGDSLEKSNIPRQTHVNKDSFSTPIIEENSSTKAIRLQDEIYKRIESNQSSLIENESEESLSKSNIFEQSIVKKDSFSKPLTKLEEDSLSKTISSQDDIYKQIESDESSIEENESEEIDRHNEFSHHFEDSLDNQTILIQPLVLIKSDSFSRPIEEDSLAKTIKLKNECVQIHYHCEEDSLCKSIILNRPLVKRDSFSRPLTKMVEDSLPKSIESVEIDKEFSHLYEDSLSKSNILNKKPLVYIKTDSFSRPFTKIGEDSLAKTINLQVKKEDVKYFFI